MPLLSWGGHCLVMLFSLDWPSVLVWRIWIVYCGTRFLREGKASSWNSLEDIVVFFTASFALE
jgi:hypothetical protein